MISPIIFFVEKRQKLRAKSFSRGEEPFDGRSGTPLAMILVERRTWLHLLRSYPTLSPFLFYSRTRTLLSLNLSRTFSLSLSLFVSLQATFSVKAAFLNLTTKHLTFVDEQIDRRGVGYKRECVCECVCVCEKSERVRVCMCVTTFIVKTDYGSAIHH
jgi:hypothetical protein